MFNVHIQFSNKIRRITWCRGAQIYAMEFWVKLVVISSIFNKDENQPKMTTLLIEKMKTCQKNIPKMFSCFNCVFQIPQVLDLAPEALLSISKFNMGAYSRERGLRKKHTFYMEGLFETIRCSTWYNPFAVYKNSQWIKTFNENNLI